MSADASAQLRSPSSASTATFLRLGFDDYVRGTWTPPRLEGSTSGTLPSLKVGPETDALDLVFGWRTASQPAGLLHAPEATLGDLGEAWFSRWRDLFEDQAQLWSQSSCRAWLRTPAPHEAQHLRAFCSDLMLVFGRVEQSALTGTACLSGNPGHPSATERLQQILDSAVFEAAEPDEETPFELEVARFVREYSGAALAAIYRAVFESDGRPDAGAALLEALALLPRRVEQTGRASIFRAGLLHAQPAIRFVAARALLRLRGPLTTEALRAAFQRESHPELRRDLVEILRLLDGGGEPAAA